MAKFRVMYTCPLKFDLERFAMNGQVPNSSAMRRLADGFNHVLCVQKKQIFCYSQDWSNTESGSGTILTLWPVAFRTSRGTTAVVVDMGIVKTDGAPGGALPEIVLQVIPLAGGATVSSASIHFNQRASSASVVPDDVNHSVTHLGGLEPNTEYKMLMRAVDGARPIYCSIFERFSAGSLTSVEGAHSTYLVDDGDADVCNPAQFESEGDILDTGIAKLITASNSLLKQSRRHLLSYSAVPLQQIAASGISISGSTSYSDVVNRSFKIDTSLLGTIRRTGADAVQCRLAVCSDRTSGTGTLSIALDDGGGVEAEITGIADDGQNNWSVATVTLPAQDATYTIHAKQSNTTTTHILYGVSLWPYEA